MRRRISRRPPSNYVWQRLQSTNETQLNGATTILLASIQNPAGGTEFVVERIRGELHVALSGGGNIPVLGESYIGAFGAAVESERAAAVGVGALPRPVTDEDYGDWLMWEPWSLAPSVSNDPAPGGGLSVNTWVPDRIEIDVKSRRRFPEDTRLVFVVEQGSNDEPVDLWFSLSVLLRERGS